MKRILVLVLFLGIVLPTALRAQAYAWRIDSIGSTKFTEYLVGATAYVTDNGRAGYGYPAGSTTAVKFLRGPSATVLFYHEMTVKNDSTERTGVWDTLRAPATYYNYDTETTVHTGIYAYDGSPGRIIGIIDPTYWGRLRIFTRTALNPGVKFVVTY